MCKWIQHSSTLWNAGTSSAAHTCTIIIYSPAVYDYTPSTCPMCNISYTQYTVLSSHTQCNCLTYSIPHIQCILSSHTAHTLRARLGGGNDGIQDPPTIPSSMWLEVSAEMIISEILMLELQWSLLGFRMNNKMNGSVLLFWSAFVCRLRKTALHCFTLIELSLQL